MTNKNIVNIHGKDYVTVAGRLEMAHEKCKTIDITTEVLVHTPNVVVKATVKTEKGLFTAISAANPAKAIEKQSPYEVAETSAVGRALGFAGFGLVEGVATADEIQKVQHDKAVETVGQEMEDHQNESNISIVASKAQVAKIQIELKRTGVDKQKIYDSFKVTSLNDLTKQEASKVIEKLVAKVVNSSSSTVNHES